MSSPGAVRRLEGLIRRHSPELYRYVLSRLKRPADAADLTQEIFERFLRGDGAGKALNPQAYLFTIAANVVTDARAALGRGVVTYDSQSSEMIAQTLPEEGPSASERLELQQELKAALARLPDMHRAAFLLAKREGLSTREVAQRLNLSEGSVMVYVCEARAKLKTWLKAGA